MSELVVGEVQTDAHDIVPQRSRSNHCVSELDVEGNDMRVARNVTQKLPADVSDRAYGSIVC